MGRLEGRVAVVTGAGKGLGKAFCIRLAQEGADIVAVTRADTDGLESTGKEVRTLGRQVLLSKIDVSKEEDTRRMASEARECFGRIDILVNNAAYYYGVARQPFTEIAVGEWDRMMAVNVRGPWLCARAVFPAEGRPGKDHQPGLRGFFHRLAWVRPLCVIKRGGDRTYQGSGSRAGAVRDLCERCGSRLYRY
jgi:3-oxoacyl-[acyl-carrier protein] reductase